MDIDDYISEKRASETKKELEEAKKRLYQEKRRLAEEERRMRELERYDAPRRSSRMAGGSTQPWMVWNFLMMGLIGLTFVISLSVALLHEHTDTTTGTSNSGSLTTTTGAVVASVNTTTTVKPATVNTSTPQNTVDEPIPDFELFLLYSEADPANPSAVKSDPLPQGGISINGTDTIYYNIVLRNKEKDYVRCDGDRITTINKGKDEDDTYYSKLKLDPFEKEELPNSVSGVGDIEVEWIFSCRFEGRLKEETNKAKFYFTLEGE